MKPVLRSIALTILILALPSGALCGPGKYDAALSAAKSWLSVVDRGDYGESWDLASQIVKDSISREKWNSSIDNARHMFGPLVSRSITVQKYTTTVPGAPDGEYLLVQTDTAFKKKQGAIETVTVKREEGGSWKVAGYFIR